MDKLFLFDAYALIYRAYYAFIRAPRINSKGQNTSAILGFCNTLQEILSKEKPNSEKRVKLPLTTQVSRLPTGQIASYRLRKDSMKFPPLAVIESFPPPLPLACR